MERHRCKLCNRRFSNGRALGGHMRSHVIPQPAPAKPPPPLPMPPVAHSPTASSSSFSAAEAAAPPAVAEEKAVGMYSLRENPRKSFRLANPEFSASFVAAAGSSSVVQDGESDAESSLHRRPKRRFREPTGEGEPLSCISDASPDEDVARCLMMLSRGAWYKSEAAGEHQPNGWDEDDEMEDYDDYDDYEEQVAARSRRKRTRFQCGTCRKVFRSYQALGGHRASHKRVGIECVPTDGIQIHRDDSYDVDAAAADHDAKIFECPYCYRIFSSGQALGGHKRSHFSSSSAAAGATNSFPALHPPRLHSSFNANYSSIDLNFPAPAEEEPELSAVSFTTEFALK